MRPLGLLLGACTHHGLPIVSGVPSTRTRENLQIKCRRWRETTFISSYLDGLRDVKFFLDANSCHFRYSNIIVIARYSKNKFERRRKLTMVTLNSWTQSRSHELSVGDSLLRFNFAFTGTGSKKKMSQLISIRSVRNYKSYSILEISFRSCRSTFLLSSMLWVIMSQCSELHQFYSLPFSLSRGRLRRILLGLYVYVSRFWRRNAWPRLDRGSEECRRGLREKRGKPGSCSSFHVIIVCYCMWVKRTSRKWAKVPKPFYLGVAYLHSWDKD